MDRKTNSQIRKMLGLPKNGRLQVSFHGAGVCSVQRFVDGVLVEDIGVSENHIVHPVTVDTIDCTTGIYDTEFTITDYGMCMIIVYPYVRWENNTGCLDFGTARVRSWADMMHVREMIDNDTLCSDDGTVTITDILNRA